MKLARQKLYQRSRLAGQATTRPVLLETGGEPLSAVLSFVSIHHLDLVLRRPGPCERSVQYVFDSLCDPAFEFNDLFNYFIIFVSLCIKLSLSFMHLGQEYSCCLEPLTQSLKIYFSFKFALGEIFLS